MSPARSATEAWSPRPARWSPSRGGCVRTSSTGRSPPRCAARPVQTWPRPGWSMPGGRTEGLASASVLASYQHVHWAGYPQLAQRFAQACAAFGSARLRWPNTGRPATAAGARSASSRGRLSTASGAWSIWPSMCGALPNGCSRGGRRADQWTGYPESGAARQALAARYGLEAGQQLLPTAGAADAFTLSRTFPGRKVVIVHPQFTEPEVAWRTAGHQVRRSMLRADEGFPAGRRPDRCRRGSGRPRQPDEPDGGAASGRRDRRAGASGRIVVVDEAFMDFVPGEPESVLAGDLDGVLVTRSLTKLWGIAGLRAGFVAGDQTLIGELAGIRNRGRSRFPPRWTPWSRSRVARPTGWQPGSSMRSPPNGLSWWTRCAPPAGSQWQVSPDTVRPGGCQQPGRLEPSKPSPLRASRCVVAIPSRGWDPARIRVSVPSEPISTALIAALIRVRGD